MRHLRHFAPTTLGDFHLCTIERTTLPPSNRWSLESSPRYAEANPFLLSADPFRGDYAIISRTSNSSTEGLLPSLLPLNRDQRVTPIDTPKNSSKPLIILV